MKYNNIHAIAVPCHLIRLDDAIVTNDQTRGRYKKAVIKNKTKNRRKNKTKNKNKAKNKTENKTKKRNKNTMREERREKRERLTEVSQGHENGGGTGERVEGQLTLADTWVQ